MNPGRFRGPPVETDGKRMCEVPVGLGEVDLVGVEELAGDRLRVTIKSGGSRPLWEQCGGRVWSKGDRLVSLVDLPALCDWGGANAVGCAPPGLWCEVVRGARPVGGARAGLVDVSRWAVGYLSGGSPWAYGFGGGRRVRVCWHTVNKEFIRWGDALLDADIDRSGQVPAVGVDETLFWHKGRWKTKQWCTSVVDVGGRQLLDIVSGRTAEHAASWFRNQPPKWCETIRWAVLDMSGPYQVAYDRVLPHANPVADPFHVVRLANRCVDLVRRRVQNETLGHRGRKRDPLYRIRRLLVMASERLDSRGETRIQGLLWAGDPYGEVRDAW